MENMEPVKLFGYTQILVSGIDLAQSCFSH